MIIRFEEEQKKERRRKIIKEIILFLAEAAVVILIAWLIIHFTMKRASMIGSSMEPTLYNGEDVIVNKTSYAFLGPGRNAVIAFYPEEKEGDEETVLDDSSILIRRVLGLPGETIQIKDGSLLINGEVYSEKYDFDSMVSAGKASSEITLGEDEYFVLSDNRMDMDDSRNTSFTVVKKENIIGKVILSLNPLSLIGGPEQKDGDEEE
jgi:signal peptidase I